MNTQRHRNPFVRVLAVTIVFLILCSPSVSLGWGAGGHMMTAQIAFGRLTPNARAKANELLAIEIDPAAETRKSTDFVNASHWADDLRPFPEFDSFKSLHFIDKPFSLDGTELPEIVPDNIVKALKDNVEILRTSTDKKAQAQALRFIIHFVGDIHQPLHCTAKVSHDRPDGDKGGNLFLMKIVGDDGELRDTNLHSYWDGGIGTFPRSGPNFAPPPLSSVLTAARLARRWNPATNRALRLNRPFNFDAWANESFRLGKTVVYTNIREGRRPSAAYIKRARRAARQRVAWGGYRLAALLNAIWAEE